MKLSKSKFISGLTCPKILWLDNNKREYKEDLMNEVILDYGKEVGSLARGLLGEFILVEFDKNLNNMINTTNELLKEENIIICEASFNYNDNFCSIDILKKEKDEYYIYEVKSSGTLKDIFINDVSYQYYVLTKLGYNVKQANLVTLNLNYVRDEELDINKLFKINDVTECVIEKQQFIEENITRINKVCNEENEPDIGISLHCFKPYPCPYFKYCSRNLPKDNIFTLPGNLKFSINKKVDLYKKGVITYDDVSSQELDNNTKMVLDYELNDKPDYIDKEHIKEFIDTLTYPLYYLDFETFHSPIPRYPHTKVYQQVPFQYSLHFLEEKDGPLKHREFLGDGITDPRRLLAEHLVYDIKQNCMVMAYNMEFEKGVIKSLADTYPDLHDKLMNIYDHCVDLIVPFKNKYYYSKRMEGSYSIKYVLPALFPNEPKLDYHNLKQVHNGEEAQDSYLLLKKKKFIPRLILRHNMLKYCGLDTYAMVMIHKKLEELIK